MELYHVLNRGVDKRAIVMDDQDRFRFTANLYAMNDGYPVDNHNYHFARSMAVGQPYSIDHEQEPLVQIHAWCLMNNHYHLLISEVAEHGMSLFLKKLNGGYAQYFNERYDRSGALFQGKTKRVLISHEAHFLWILHYIHCNPLDYFKKAGDWRAQCLIKPERALAWLKRYRWSSYQDYGDEPNFPEIIQGSFMFEDRREHMRESKRYLRALGEGFESRLALE